MPSPFEAPTAPVAQEVTHFRFTVDYLVVTIPEVPEVPAVPAVLDPETEEEIAPAVPAVPAVPAHKNLIKKGAFRCEVPFSDGMDDKIIQKDAMPILTDEEKADVVAIMDRVWPLAYALGDDTEPITT